MKSITYKYRFFLLVIVAFLTIITNELADAAPLFNVPQVLTQPDGTLLHCLVSGDEHKHFVHTQEQFIIEQNPITGYYYITNKRITDSITNSNSQLSYKAKDIFLSLDNKNNKGNLTNLVAFVRFSDDTDYDVPFAFYDSVFNSKSGASLLGYYQVASYSQLTVNSYFFPAPTNKQVNSYKLKQPRNYYIEYSKTNPAGYKNEDDAQNRKIDMIKEILQYLNKIVPSNIKLDGNVENYLDNVTIILKGSSDGWGKILWPHHSTTKSGANGFFQKIDSVEVHDYIVLMSGGINVGVVCHEFFHSLGAPDLYRYNNPDNIFPLHTWDLMGNQYNVPQFMTAYMKHKYGKWIDKIPTIIYPGEYSLNPLTMQDSNCYAINIAGTEEYLVLEYRKPEGKYETSLRDIIMQFEENKIARFDGGLLIYRINNKQAGKGNSNAGDTIPDEIYCYRPNDTKTANGEPWNSAFNMKYLKNEFYAKTDPAPVLFNGDTAKLRINNIYEDENKLYFTYHNDSVTFIKWPIDGDWNSSRYPVIIWDLLKTPCTYYLQISNNNTFTSLEINESIYNDSIFYSSLLLPPNKYYYARVGSTSSNSGGIIWSRTIHFRTKDLIEIYGYYKSICAGNSFELQYDIFDATLENTEFDVLLSDKNGTWDNPVLLGTTSLQMGFNSIHIYLPDSLKTGYRYLIKLQSKNNGNAFATSNNIAIYGLARAKIYTNIESQTNDNTIQCRNSISTIYFEPILSATQNTYCNYKWTSKNCEIIDTNHLNNSIDVKWNKVGRAAISLIATNQHGCQQTYTKNITVSEVPKINFATKGTVCAQVPTIYHLPTEKYTITDIQVDGGTYNQNHRDSISIIWDNVPVGYINITRAFENGCADSVKIPQPINYIANIEITGKDTIYKGKAEQYQVTLSNQIINTNQYNIEWKSNYGEILSGNSASCIIYVDSTMIAEAKNDTLILEVTVVDKNTLCSKTFSKSIITLGSIDDIFVDENSNNKYNIIMASEEIIIKFNDENILSNNIKIELYNILGNAIITLDGTNDSNYNTNQFYIKTHNIPIGVYFLRVYYKNELTYNNIIMIN